ncbi:hypothetical protein JCM16303_000887 [Sporobolomyces ruberrimus]
MRISALLAGGLACMSLVVGQKAGTFEIVGDSGVSAQQLFQHKNKVYVIDKTENNPARVNGHPAWAVSYDIETNNFRAQDIVSNTFCAGGTALGNGSYLNVGGNAAVTALGVGVAPGGPNSYGNIDGGKAIRMITPCDDDSCEWTDDVNAMPLSRWYPTVETLPDGSAIIIGGELYGSYVNTPQGGQNVPSIEFWPRRSPDDVPVNVTFLEETMPVNLYPLTWLLSDGRLFMQAGWLTTLYDYDDNVESRLPNITHAQRPYPAGAGSIMLPMLPPDYSQTIVFAGGLNPEREDWNQNEWDIIDTPASSSVVGITPLDDESAWIDYDDLPEGRTMGNLIQLPDQRILLLNGAAQGSEGYGWDDFALNQSYAQGPRLSCRYFTPAAPTGSQWDEACGTSTIPRMYHSTATLLYDGSVFVAGSNPNVDVIDESNNASYVFHTEYRVERFYPSYYDSPRPMPRSFPPSLSYGGDYFDLMLSWNDLTDVDLTNDISIVLIRTGFSTHVMNMGARMLVLAHSFTASPNETTLHCSQLPPNPSLFAPGPAMLFVVVKGVPSFGVETMVASGQLGPQPALGPTVLPASSSTETGDRLKPAGNLKYFNEKLESGHSVHVDSLVSLLGSYCAKLDARESSDGFREEAATLVSDWNNFRTKQSGRELCEALEQYRSKAVQTFDKEVTSQIAYNEQQACKLFEIVCRDLVEYFDLDWAGSEEILRQRTKILDYHRAMFSVDQNVRVELPAGNEACRTLLRAATPQGILACSAFRLITNFSDEMKRLLPVQFNTNANFLALFRPDKHGEPDNELLHSFWASVKVASSWPWLLTPGLQPRQRSNSPVLADDPFTHQITSGRNKPPPTQYDEFMAQLERRKTNSLERRTRRKEVPSAFVALSRSSLV